MSATDHDKLTETFTLKLSSADMAQLATVVSLEREHARPGHRVSARDLARLAIRQYLQQRLRRRAARDAQAPAT